MNRQTLPNTEIVNYFKSTEEEMQRLLDKGPLVVAIAVGESLYYYSKGILTNCGVEDSTLDTLNHAVVLVGYGVDSETNLPYWKIQNSWTDQWGDGGYFRVLRDGKCRCGLCFVPSQIKLRRTVNSADSGDSEGSSDAYDDMNYVIGSIIFLSKIISKICLIFAI